MKQGRNYFKLILLLIVIGAFFAARKAGLDHYLSLTYLKENLSQLQEFVSANRLLSSSYYLFGYILATALSIPGATLITLAGGALFGLWHGLILVSFASTIGATVAFLLSRFFLREWVSKKFSSRIESIESGIKKDGAFYLLSLRLVPVVPFFLINLVMGITPIKTFTFYWVSQLGMLAGTFVYVNAGTQLSQIENVKDIASPSLLLAFALLGILPWISRWILNALKNRKIYRDYKRPKKYDYNLLVIGAGSAGLVSSYIAAAVKAKVGLIERHKMGGDCLNTGCVPSKALIKSAKVVHTTSKLSQYGLDGESAKVDFAKVMDRVQNVIQKIEPHDSIERYSNLGVECIQGQAEILDPFHIKVNDKVLSTKNIIIATGARPLVPPIPGLDQVPHYTSDTIWNLREQPKKLLVLGGGPIGCELAQSFGRLGSEVILVEMAPRLMFREDPDVSTHIESVFKAEGMKIQTGHKATKFYSEKGKNFLDCEFKGASVTIEFDAALLALGRKPNITGFGLEKMGIEISKRGTVEHDAFLRTKFPNILVCGDVAGPYQFTHTAAHQAWYAAVNSLFAPLANFKVDYSVIPWCTFCDPEVARVGISETEAKEQNIEYDVTNYGIDDLDRAIADSEDQGFVRVISAKGGDKILGATIVGSHAGDMITEFVSAMKHKIGLNKILGTIHIYPTHSEANKFVAGQWKQKNKPEGLLKKVEAFHKWRRS